MAAADERQRLARRFVAFAADEAGDASPIYAELSRAVAASPELLDFLLEMPRERRQPNLFLGAIRHLHGVPETPARLADLVRLDPARIRAVMLARTTQTNEPGRCAVLLPILGQIPPPLALIEVGASAGLCLLPERYGYDYGVAQVAPPSPGAPVFRCRIDGPVPLPAAAPAIAWRRGLDLDPIDLGSDDAVAWLETLVWPGQDERAVRLRQAIAVARRDPPIVVKGDLSRDLEPLMREAPRDATLVVFHTAVLPYVAPPERARFADRMAASRAVWICNEAAGLAPTAPDVPPAPRPGLFLLRRNGVPLAWTGPHGQSIDWIGDA